MLQQRLNCAALDKHTHTHTHTHTHARTRARHKSNRLSSCLRAFSCWSSLRSAQTHRVPDVLTGRLAPLAGLSLSLLACAATRGYYEDHLASIIDPSLQQYACALLYPYTLLAQFTGVCSFTASFI